MQLLKIYDQLNEQVRSLQDSISSLRASIVDKAHEVQDVAINPKVVLEYLQLHPDGLALSSETIRGLSALFDWPLEDGEAEGFTEVKVDGSSTTFLNPTTGESFSVALGSTSAAQVCFLYISIHFPFYFPS